MEPFGTIWLCMMKTLWGPAGPLQTPLENIGSLEAWAMTCVSCRLSGLFFGQLVTTVGLVLRIRWEVLSGSILRLGMNSIVRLRLVPKHIMLVFYEWLLEVMIWIRSTLVMIRVPAVTWLAAHINFEFAEFRLYVGAGLEMCSMDRSVIMVVLDMPPGGPGIPPLGRFLRLKKILGRRIRLSSRCIEHVKLAVRDGVRCLIRRSSVEECIVDVSAGEGRDVMAVVISYTVTSLVNRSTIVLVVVLMTWVGFIRSVTYSGCFRAIIRVPFKFILVSIILISTVVVVGFSVLRPPKT